MEWSGWLQAINREGCQTNEHTYANEIIPMIDRTFVSYRWKVNAVVIGAFLFRLRLHIKFASWRPFNKNGADRCSFYDSFPVMSSLIEEIISSSCVALSLECHRLTSSVRLFKYDELKGSRRTNEFLLLSLVSSLMECMRTRNFLSFSSLFFVIILYHRCSERFLLLIG